MRLARLFGLGLAVALASAVPGCSCGKGKRGAVSPGRGEPGAPNLRHKGAAHTSTIDMIALAPDGTAAVTRDIGGGVRLWPALDGTKEPIPLPARGVEHMSVASNKTRSGWTVAVVESSGQGTIFAVERGGAAEVLVSLPPHDPLYEAHVIAGGERLVSLHRDSSIRMLRRDGRELGRFERRKFAPRQLRVSDDGKRVVGIVEEGVLNGQLSGYLYPISVTDDPQRVFVGGKPEPFSTTFAPNRSNSALSPDGRFFVFMAPDQAGQTLRLLVHDLARPGGRRSFATSAPAFSVPTVGFAGRAHVIITTPANEGTAWQVSLADGRTVPRSGPPRNAQAVAVGANMLAAGYGTWLYLQEASGANERFLGYETFRPGAVAFSPKGEWLAWGYDRAEVYVEPFFGPDRTPTRLESDVQDRMRFLFFVDEHHVLGIDTSNTMLLVDWTRGQVVSESSVPWSLSDVQFEPDSRVLLLDGAHQGKRIIEIDTKAGFSGQYILPDDARRSGLFAKSVGGGALLWTVGNDGKLRTYTLAEIKRGFTPDEVLKKGEFLPPGNLLAIDRMGNRYVSASGRISVSRGVNTKTIELPTEFIVPSWDGKTMLAMTGDRDGVRIAAYDTNSLEERWTHHVSVFPNSTAWTRDGRYVAIASEAGGIVLDAKNGKPIGFRCGLDFEKKGAPPPDAFNQSGLRSVCEP